MFAKLNVSPVPDLHTGKDVGRVGRPGVTALHNSIRPAAGA